MVVVGGLLQTVALSSTRLHGLNRTRNKLGLDTASKIGAAVQRSFIAVSSRTLGTTEMGKLRNNDMEAPILFNHIFVKLCLICVKQRPY